MIVPETKIPVGMITVPPPAALHFSITSLITFVFAVMPSPLAPKSAILYSLPPSCFFHDENVINITGRKRKRYFLNIQSVLEIIISDYIQTNPFIQSNKYTVSHF